MIVTSIQVDQPECRDIRTIVGRTAGRDDLTSNADGIFELCLLSRRCETSADEEGHCCSTRPEMSFAYQRQQIVKRLIASMSTATESGEIDCVSFNDDFVFVRYSVLVNDDNRIHSRLVRCNSIRRTRLICGLHYKIITRMAAQWVVDGCC